MRQDASPGRSGLPTTDRVLCTLERRWAPSARPNNLSATEGVTRDGWSDPPTHVSGDWLVRPTQVTSRYDSNAPWAPEAVTTCLAREMEEEEARKRGGPRHWTCYAFVDGKQCGYDENKAAGQGSEKKCGQH